MCKRIMDIIKNSGVLIYVSVFRKTNRSARKSIIAYARKYVFERKDANGNEEKEAHFAHRRSVGLAGRRNLRST